MLVEARLTVPAPRAAVWSVVTDVDRAAEVLSGVVRVEVVERPASGLVGLRWRETRVLFGEEATVEKRVSAAVDGTSYETRAEQDGFLFVTTLQLVDAPDGTTLVSTHATHPQGLLARLKALPLVFFRGVLRKAILQDLGDYGAAVERA